MTIVALARPVSNLLIAVLWALITRLGVTIGAGTEAVSLPLIYSGVAGISINLVLALINLLPIPPLDGSRILTGCYRVTGRGNTIASSVSGLLFY